MPLEVLTGHKSLGPSAEVLHHVTAVAEGRTMGMDCQQLSCCGPVTSHTWDIISLRLQGTVSMKKI